MTPEFTIVDDGKDRFARLKGKDGEESSYELRMIGNNRIRELIGVRSFRLGAETAYDYDIAGLAPLKDCEGKDAADYLYSVIAALERLGEALNDHMLSADRIILDPALIFLRRETGSVSFCYFPCKSTPFQEELQALMEFFLKVIEPSGEAEVLLLYGLYQKSRESNVRPGTLADFWRENRGAEAQAGKAEPDLSALTDEETAGLGTGSDSLLYRELGLTESVVSRPFFRWRAAGEQELPAEKIIDAPFSQEAEKNSPGTKKSSGLTGFLRKNGFELAAAAAVAAGLMAFFSR